MPLTEPQRQQLDGIVSQMEANHEPEDNIRFVVGDFKAKYDRPVQEEISQEQAPMGGWEAAGQVAKGFGSALIAPAMMAGTAAKESFQSAQRAPEELRQGQYGAAAADFLRGLNPSVPLVESGIRAQYEQGRQAVENLRQGRYFEAAGHGAAAALPVMGPVAASLGEKIGTGDPRQQAEAAGEALGLLALPKAGELTVRGGSAAVRGTTDWVTRTAAGAREGGIGGAVARGIRAAAPLPSTGLATAALKPSSRMVQWQQRIGTALDAVKSVEAETGTPIKDLNGFIDATTEAQRLNRAQYDALQAPGRARGDLINGTPVAEAIRKSIPASTRLENPRAAAAIDHLADAYRRDFTLAEVDQLIQDKNAALKAYQSKYPAQKAATLKSNPEVAHDVAAADTLKDLFYHHLDQPGEGGAATALQREYGALAEAKQAALSRRNVAERQQPESLSEQIGQVRAASEIADVAFGVITGHPIAAALRGIARAKLGAEAANFLKEQNTSDALIRRALEQHKGRRAPIEMPPPTRIAGQLPPANIRLGPSPDPSYARGVQAEPGIPLREGEIVTEPAAPPPAQLPSGRTGARALPPASFRMPASTTQGTRVSGPPPPTYTRGLTEPPVRIYPGERPTAPRQLPERGTPESVRPVAPVEPPPPAPVQSTAPAPTKVVKPIREDPHYVRGTKSKGKAPAPTAAPPVETPAAAAAKVEQHLERVIDVSGEKTAGAIQARVMKALEQELQRVKGSAGPVGEITFQPLGSGKAGGSILENGEHIADVDYRGDIQISRYSDHEALRIPKPEYWGPNQSGGVRQIGKIDKWNGSEKQQRDALAQISRALTNHRGVDKLVVRIPGDGTFTLEQTPAAIDELMRRMKRAGPSIWRDLAKSGKKR